MAEPTIYFADINDPDETGTEEPNFCDVVLAEGYDRDIKALRAQLPSQGGEAVAVSLELVENLKYGGMHIRKWDNLAGLSAGTHKLYTHPADQVAEGVVVSRELLEQASEGLQVLDTLIESIQVNGNYSSAATVNFLNQAAGCFYHLRQLLAKSEGVKK